MLPTKPLVTLYWIIYVDGPEVNEVQAIEQPTRYLVTKEQGGYFVGKDRACLTPLQAIEQFIKDLDDKDSFAYRSILGRPKMRVLDKALAFKNQLLKEQNEPQT